MQGGRDVREDAERGDAVHDVDEACWRDLIETGREKIVAFIERQEEVLPRLEVIELDASAPAGAAADDEQPGQGQGRQHERRRFGHGRHGRQRLSVVAERRNPTSFTQREERLHAVLPS